MNWIIKIYNYFSAHTKLLWLSATGLCMLFVCLIFNLKYNENIADFLPFGTSEREAVSVYQNISGADRIYVLFDSPGDADYTIDAIDCFTMAVRERDSSGWCADLIVRFDRSQIQEVMDFVYDHIPYFLTDADYTRMDSVLAKPGYVSSRLMQDKEMLMLAPGGIVTSGIIRDPLGLFAPVMESLQDVNPQEGFELYDGYIFTSDMRRAIAMMRSPFGNSETEYNARILNVLQRSIEDMVSLYPEVSARVVGGPEIAVGNATRIKRDSLWATALAVVLIVLLVAYSIGSFRNILLIFLSIGWGWLFAMGGMALFSPQVSIIVIGISSVILGIAVNYPLHMIVHMSYETDRRAALKEVMAPLVIGNITTVGAFLALVPLQSAALRDLGVFASLLLIGTILFVLLYLPHWVKINKHDKERHTMLERVAAFAPEKHRVLVISVAVLTLIFFFFSLRTEFDTNVANINYMTDDQRTDMQYFQELLTKSTSETTQNLYVLSVGESYDEALVHHAAVTPVIDSLVANGFVLRHSGVSRFLSSAQEQRQRLDRWAAFVVRHKAILTEALVDSAMRCGFAPDAFTGFMEMFNEPQTLAPQDMAFFAPLVQSVLNPYVTRVDEAAKCYIVDVLDVEKEQLETVKSHFVNCFDVMGMNSALSRHLSDNFNYIGWVCSLIVFIFLWLSFGRLELALISFLPMVISWIWILGIMAMFGIKFNIVNIILATFIFGQGDDYTIFVTEGCQHEYLYRRPILASYKSSILQSALIMFIGIGTLIVAKHPAMKSLAEVTIIGMFAVVWMAYMIPPFLFRWLTVKHGVTRTYPLTIGRLLHGIPKEPVDKVIGRYIYKGRSIVAEVKRNLREFMAAGIYPDMKDRKTYSVADEGYGEVALLLALMYPEVRIIARVSDEDRWRIAVVAATDFIDNIEFIK